MGKIVTDGILPVLLLSVGDIWAGFNLNTECFNLFPGNENGPGNQEYILIRS